MHQIANERVDGNYRRRPGTADLSDRGALADFSLLANHQADPLQFLRHSLVAFHHVVERVGYLSRDAAPVQRKPHPEIPLLQRRQRRQHFLDVNVPVRPRRCLKARFGLLCGNYLVRTILFHAFSPGKWVKVAAGRRTLGNLFPAPWEAFRTNVFGRDTRTTAFGQQRVWELNSKAAP